VFGKGAVRCTGKWSHLLVTLKPANKGIFGSTGLMGSAVSMVTVLTPCSLLCSYPL
jgi:hypothetical protein